MTNVSDIDQEMISCPKISLYDLLFEAGSHVQFDGTIHNSLKTGIECGMYSIQIFLGNPKSYDRSVISKEDLQASINLEKRFPMNIFIHTPYLFNLAGSKDILAWNGNYRQDRITSKIVESLSYELEVLSAFTASGKVRGVVVHPGNYINKEQGLTNIAKTINKIKFPEQYTTNKDGSKSYCGPKLLLENSSGGGTSLATTFEEIKYILDNLDEHVKEKVGVCIDTAHIYGFGLYDLADICQVDQLFEDFDNIIGCDKFTLLHLNDSMCSEEKCKNAFFGSKKDRHELLGGGHIWGNGNHFPLIRLLSECITRDIPIILETSPTDMKVLSLLSDSIKKLKEKKVKKFLF
jgi:deoxyribonuclease IV